MAKKKFQIGSSLASGLEETVSVAQSYYSSLNIVIIPIHKVKLDDENPRELSLSLKDLPEGPNSNDPLFEVKLKEYNELLSLAESIKKEGLLNPIIVYKKNESYQLIAGERRTLASIIAGEEMIQAKVLESMPSPLRLSILQWIENIERKDLTLWERLSNIKKIISNYDSSSKNSLEIKELAEILGCTFKQASNYKLVLESNNELIESIKNNKIKNLEKAAYIARIEDAEIRAEAINQCAKGITIKNLKLLCEKVRDSHSETSRKYRGRQYSNVKLGSTSNTKVVKNIVCAITSSKKFQHLDILFKDVDWSNYTEASKAFKKMLTELEKCDLPSKESSYES